MKPNHLEELLKKDAPAPDPAARLAARRAALAEFARVQAASAKEPAKKPASLIQGLLARLRLSREPQASGSDSMRWYSNKVWIGAAASVCIALVGSTVMWNTLREDPRIAAIQGDEVAAPAPMANATPPPAPKNEGAGPQPTPAAASAAPAADAGTLARADEARAMTEQSRLEKSRHDAELPVARATAQQELDPAVVRDTAQKVQARAAGAKDDALGAGHASAGAVAPAAVPPAEALDNVVVTGARATAQSSMEVKREAVPVQSIQAETVVEEYSANAKQSRSRQQVAQPAAAPATVGGLLSFNRAPEPMPPPPAEYEGRDKFEQFEVNSIKQPAIEAERVSTFSADVDTASYSFVRKMLDRGVLPQKDAVRVEEMINYFSYAWPAADSRERPFQPTVVVSDSPWGKGRKLIHIGIKGYELPARQRPDANLVMLLDVSGSMSSPDKLPLVKQSMKLLLGSLKPTDTVAIVVYAGAAGQVLAPTPVGEKDKIIAALDSLTPGGSTAGAEGIELAYQLAEKSFRKEGVNRILLCTDGDFNVGIDSTNELKGFVERKREKGVFLSVLGFGQGNYRDELAQALAQNGNGVAAYIDTLSEAQKVLVQEAGSSLFTIAKDVKLQVEFNPATVAEYRLVGYETRALKREDFNNDAVDAGDVGAGHTVTAIYEITPVGVDARMIEESRYVKPAQSAAAGTAGEYGFLKIRYKLPKEDKSHLIEQPIRIDSGRVSEAIRRDVQFSTAVAGFAQLLRGGKYTGSLSYDDVIKQGLAARGEDPYGYRNEFVQLARKAQTAKGM